MSKVPQWGVQVQHVSDAFAGFPAAHPGLDRRNCQKGTGMSDGVRGQGIPNVRWIDAKRPPSKSGYSQVVPCPHK